MNMNSTNNQTAPSPRRSLNGTGVLRIPGRTSSDRNKPLRIATWNVRTLYEAGRLHNLIQEINRLSIDIMGICEVRWTDSGVTRSGGCSIYYSGTRDGRHINGVAIVLKEQLSRLKKNFVPISDRVMLLQMDTKPIGLNLIQVYAPTVESPDDEVEEFYQQVEMALKYTRGHEMTLIMGDFNAKVGSVAADGVTGRYGLGDRNERGSRLIGFCQDNQFTIMNTCFQLPKRRLCTWRSPSDGIDGSIIRNQIDYMLLGNRFKNSMTSVKAYPGADVNSDHSPLVGCVRLRLKMKTARDASRALDVRLLKQPEIGKRVAKEINDSVHRIATITENPDEAWRAFKTPMLEGMKPLRQRASQTKQEWMTTEILGLMEQRRQFKDRNRLKYDEVHRTIRQKITEAKEKWLQESCGRIERLQGVHDVFNLHKELKKAAGKYRKKHINLLKMPDGRYTSDPNVLCPLWRDYIRNIFVAPDPDENAAEPVPDGAVEGSATPLPILETEVELAIKQTRSNRAPGPDEIPADIIKLLDEGSIRKLTQFFNVLYLSGQLPNEWLDSTFVPLPKKSKPSKCEEYRLISLMSHSLKIFLKIIHNRIYSTCESAMGREQFGFRGGMGTREALFCMNVILQKSCEFRKNVYVCFIDFQRAFDSVCHRQLFECLDNIGIDSQDAKILKQLYRNQTARVKVEHLTTEAIPIERGVRQGCVLSPALFNLYSEQIFREALADCNVGVRIGGETINNIKYADDTALLAESIEDLQTLLNRVDQACRDKGLSINALKTKWMVAGRIGVDPNTKLTLGNSDIERVDRFRYLGCWINSDNDSDMEIRARIEMARSAFNAWRTVLTNRHLKMSTRLRVLGCYVWSVLQYASETWTLKTSTMNRLEAFELWCYRRMLRVSWTSHTTNEEVLRRVGTDRVLLTSIKRRKLSYFGHVIRGPKYDLLKLLIQGKVEGKRWIGRKKLSWLRNVRQWTGLRVEQLFRIAADREAYQQLIDMMTANA